MKRGLKREELELQDGRTLSYTVDQPSDEKHDELPVIFYFHGMFGKGSDFITKSPPTTHTTYFVDRAGYAGSSVVPSRSTWCYGDFAHDVEQLADSLNVDTFYVLGHSSGGPCALACAGHLGDRVTGVCAMAGDIEYAAEGAPKQWCMLYGFLCLMFFMPLCFLLLSFGGLCGPFAGRTMGAFSDYRVERKPYDFSIESISQPTLFVTGNLDTTVPPADTKFTHERIQGSELMIIKGADHISVLSEDNMKKIIQKLLSMDARTVADIGP